MCIRVLALAGERRLRSYLGHGEAALAAGHHLVPLVVQHVHEAVGLVLAHELRDVGGERRVLRESDPVACGAERRGADPLLLRLTAFLCFSEAGSATG